MTDRFAALVDERAAETVHVLGPTITFLTPPDGDGDAPCVLRGQIPPGVVVPLHSHADPETFLMESGDLQALAGPGGRRRAGPGRGVRRGVRAARLLERHAGGERRDRHRRPRERPHSCG